MRSLIMMFFVLAACGPSRHRPDAGGGSNGESGNSCSASDQCSADLHSVLDCNGNVVSTCPADQGCSAGSCVPACQSAADNKSSIGCDYYSVDPDIIAEGTGACFAAYIANTWGSPVAITVERMRRVMVGHENAARVAETAQIPCEPSAVRITIAATMKGKP